MPATLRPGPCSHPLGPRPLCRGAPPPSPARDPGPPRPAARAHPRGSGAPCSAADLAARPRRPCTPVSPARQAGRGARRLAACLSPSSPFLSSPLSHPPASCASGVSAPWGVQSTAEARAVSQLWWPRAWPPGLTQGLPTSAPALGQPDHPARRLDIRDSLNQPS
jgi:hypothetical protein